MKFARDLVAGIAAVGGMRLEEDQRVREPVGIDSPAEVRAQ
jgi:hypothetical protein